MKYVWLVYLQILFVMGANRGRSWVDNQILLCYNKLDKLDVNYVKWFSPAQEQHFDYLGFSIGDFEVYEILHIR